jgi:hypothetical protein
MLLPYNIMIAGIPFVLAGPLVLAISDIFIYLGEPERAPQFGGSSSSSAMHYGAFVRCTYVLPPFRLAPAILRTFGLYTVNYSKFYGPFASHRLTIFHATCDEIYSSCQITSGNWNGQYYAPINVKPQKGGGAYMGDLTFCANFRSKAPLWGWKSKSNVFKFPTVGLEI